MNADSLSEIQKTRFLALNFSRLQVWRVVPFGLALSLVVLWANSQPALREFPHAGINRFGCGVFYFLVNRYYHKAYGHAVASANERKMDWIMAVVGGLLGLAAILLDNNLKLPWFLLGWHWPPHMGSNIFGFEFCPPLVCANRSVLDCLSGWSVFYPSWAPVAGGDNRDKKSVSGICLVQAY